MTKPLLPSDPRALGREIRKLDPLEYDVVRELQEKFAEADGELRKAWADELIRHARAGNTAKVDAYIALIERIQGKPSSKVEHEHTHKIATTIKPVFNYDHKNPNQRLQLPNDAIDAG